MKKEDMFLLIPARAGSKGVKDKNSRNFCGKPLICHTIDSVINDFKRENIIVSTNCPKLQDICEERYGKNITLHKRSDRASSDQSPIMETIEEIRYLIRDVTENVSLCLLQPTSPLRKKSDIHKAIDIHIKNNRGNLVSVTKAKHNCFPEKILVKESESQAISYIKDLSVTQRQKLKKQYLVRNGAIYISSLHDISKGLVRDESLFYEMPSWKSIDIDTVDDWRMAELIMNNQNKLEVTKSASDKIQGYHGKI